jgi:cysteine desulfurase
MAMGLKRSQAQAAVRFSLGKLTTQEELDYTVGCLVEEVSRLREISPVWKKVKGQAAPVLV